MTLQPETIEVMFRKYTGKSAGILAVFPYEAHDREGRSVSCYAHIGQHGGAQMTHILAATRPAKPDQYAELYEELQGMYERSTFPRCPIFKLRIIKRRSSKRMSKLFEKARQ